jgi:hypothetical protein
MVCTPAWKAAWGLSSSPVAPQGTPSWSRLQCNRGPDGTLRPTYPMSESTPGLRVALAGAREHPRSGEDECVGLACGIRVWEASLPTHPLREDFFLHDTAHTCPSHGHRGCRSRRTTMASHSSCAVSCASRAWDAQPGPPHLSSCPCDHPQSALPLSIGGGRLLPRCRHRVWLSAHAGKRQRVVCHAQRGSIAGRFGRQPPLRFVLLLLLAGSFLFTLLKGRS